MKADTQSGARASRRAAGAPRRAREARPARVSSGARFGTRQVLLGVTVAVVLGIVVYGLWGNAPWNAAGDGGKTAGSAVGEVTGPPGGPVAATTLAVGAAAPDLLWTFDGKSESIAGLKGKVILLEFFAVWCPHCQTEAPLLTRLSERYADRGVRVIGVSASPLARDQRGRLTVSEIQAYAAQYGAHFPQLHDPRLVGAQRYGVRSFPMLFAIDAGGVIRFTGSGEVPEPTIDAALAPLLAAAVR